MQKANAPFTKRTIAPIYRATENFGLVYNDASLSFSGRYDDNGNMLYYWTVTFYSDGEEAYLVHVDTETGEVINSFDLSEGNG